MVRSRRYGSRCRSIFATLAADGSIAGALHETYFGWPYSLARGSHRRLSEPEYLKRPESRITRGIRAAKVRRETSDAPPDGQFSVSAEFASPYYAQIMQGRLMVFRPSVLYPTQPVPGGRSKRQHPAILNAGTWVQSTRVQLPKEFDIDEKPGAVRIDSPYGIYEADCLVEAGMPSSRANSPCSRWWFPPLISQS